MNEWNIQSRGHQCATCGKKFEDKARYHTVLVDLKQEFTRQDICPVCWQNQYGDGATDQKGFISYWQGTYEAPPPAPPEPIRKESAESTLRRLIELNNPDFGPAAYIMAVMLERKRLLKVKEQLEREGQRIFIYEQPKTGDLFTVTDPDLQLDQLEEVQRIVADLLEFGLDDQGNIHYPPPREESEESRETENADTDSVENQGDDPETAEPESSVNVNRA